MSVTPAIRVVRFRCVRPGLDAALRSELIPSLRLVPGHVGVVAGRQGPDELGSRLLASVWTSADALSAAFVPGMGSLAGLPDPDAVADVETEDLAVQVLFEAPQGASPGIVRALRGWVRPGQLAAYVEDARRGMQEDVEAGRGPVAFYLATPDSRTDEFLTVSAWSDWGAIERATGGNIQQPLVTRHPERIVAFDVVHYEAISLQ